MKIKILNSLGLCQHIFKALKTLSIKKNYKSSVQIEDNRNNQQDQIQYQILFAIHTVSPLK